jgi:hypothetical protein
MAPVPSSHDPPTNIAQMGMGWNILSGTIDLGLTVFDAVFVVKDWIREFTKHRAKKAKQVEIIKMGKRPPQRRSVQFSMSQDS